MSKTQGSATRRTYIHPFLDFKRNLVFLGTFLGMYGFALVNTVSSYDLASAAYSAFFTFACAAYVTAGFIYWPLLYMGFSSTDSLGWRVFLFILQLFALGLYVQTPPDPLLQGLVSGVMIAPFWTTHHIAMVQNTTSENRGYEVSLGMFITMGSALLSALTSGYFLEMQDAHVAIIISLATMMLGTLCFLLSMKIVRQHTIRHYIAECKRVMHDNPYMIRRIVSHSFFDLPTLAIAGIMKMTGISPTGLATILIVRLVLMAVLSPAIGTISHQYRKHGYGIGLLLIGLSWLLLTVDPGNAILFMIFMMIFNVGNRIADGSLMTGLYEMQSYASMMWSEVYMSIGRVISLLLFMPILYWNVRVYLVVLAAVAGLIFITNRKWQRRWADAQAM